MCCCVLYVCLYVYEGVIVFLDEHKLVDVMVTTVGTVVCLFVCWLVVLNI